MSSTTVMKAKARLIKEETQEGANTAARVGGLFEDIVDYLDSADVTSSLEITPYVTTGTRIAKFKVNGEETTIFAPSNGGSGGGGGSSYDDTEIREIINELDKALDDTTELANSEKDRLNGVIADIDANVKQKMADAIEFAEWVQGNFPEGETGYQSGWNEKTKQFMQVVGMWEQDAQNPVVTTTTWSALNQRVNQLALDVTSIVAGEDVTTEMLQSWIDLAVEDEIASLNLGTTYATQDDTGEIIKWLYSALKGSTSEYTTYNQFVSAARNEASTAISELRTYVEQLKDGSFIANANIVSKVDDAIAELYTSASSNNAKTYIFSTIDKNSQDIATIVSAATGDSVTVDIATRFATWKAGLATKSYVDGATAGLVAANDYNAAAIVAMINGAGSSITLSADKIDFKGENDYPLYFDFGVGNGVKYSTLKMDVPANWDGNSSGTRPLNANDPFPSVVELGIDTSRMTQYLNIIPYLELNSYYQDAPNSIERVIISPDEIKTSGTDISIQTQQQVTDAGWSSAQFDIVKISSSYTKATSYIQLNEGVPIKIIDNDGQQLLETANISSVTLNGEPYIIINGLIVKSPSYTYSA